MDDTQAILAMKELLKRPVAYHRAFARIGGGATAGLMLSQAWYWTPKADESGWFYKTVKEWEEETGLTEAEQETARKRLVERGLLKVKRAGMPARLHFQVQVVTAFRLLGEDTESSSGKTANQEWAKQPIKSGQNSQPLYTETTTEITEESQSIGARAETLLADYGDVVKKVTGLHFNTKRKWLTLIEVRLREGWTDAQLSRAFKGCSLDPWPDRWRFNDVPTVLKDGDSIERFIEFADNEGRQPPEKAGNGKSEQHTQQNGMGPRASIVANRNYSKWGNG